MPQDNLTYEKLELGALKTDLKGEIDRYSTELPATCTFRSNNFNNSIIYQSVGYVI